MRPTLVPSLSALLLLASSALSAPSAVSLQDLSAPTDENWPYALQDQSQPPREAKAVEAQANEAQANQAPDHSPPNESQPSEAEEDASTFASLLSSVPASALHAALHTFVPARFRHGAFVADSAAASAVWASDPSLASTMVLVAKRQAGTPDNATSTAVPPLVTVTSTVTNPGPTPIVVVTSTSIAPVPVVSSPASVAPVPTAPSPSVPVLTSTAAPVSTTAVTTSALTTSTPSSTTVTSTSSTSTLPLTLASGFSGTVRLTSSHPGGGSTVVVMTTTLPNGSLSTLTAVTVVNEPGKTPAGQETSTATASGSLQTPNAAANLGRGLWGLGAGLAGAVVLGGL